MAKKRTVINLTALTEESAIELKAMVKELCDANPWANGDAAVHWSKRFSASGKDMCGSAPRIRLE